MEPQQRSEDWHQARLGKATASRFADVMAKIRSGEAAARRNYRAELIVERLTGQPTETYTSREMQWGIDNEPVARMTYSLETGNPVEECFFFQHELLAAGASPDGLVGSDGLIEIKCPNTATHIETLRTGKVPAQYFPQVQGQMWITGRKWCDFVSFDPRLPDNAQFFTIRVPRDEEYITTLEKEVNDFLYLVDAELEFVAEYGKEKVAA